MIKVDHLRKTYRKKVAVDDLSFTVETGKVTGFLGPNGAGKSTTMRLMLGLDGGKGTTLYAGKPLHSYARPSQTVGILLEAKAFHPSRTARNHLKVLAAASGVDATRVDEVLDVVGLKEVAKKGPGKFSLGMSQRLGIAAAILGQPKYLMLDEPANGLDPEGIAWLRQFIKDYAKAGNAVFVSSHLLSEMAQMADNVVVIGRGKLIADTSMDKILAGSTHTGVFVRTPDADKMRGVLEKNKLIFSTDSQGITITGSRTEDIGELAFKAKVRLHELTSHSASLEEAFLELTADAQEYSAHKDGKAKS
jgi:ABC-2 type transport system ATP-binding protein